MTIKLPDEDVVLELHEIVLLVSPGKEGIHDINQIKSAVQRPHTYVQYEPDYNIDTICALLIDSVARNHGFKDGNKRTALMTAVFTYRINGVHFNASKEMNEEFDSIIMHVVLNKPSINELVMKLHNLRQKYQGDKETWRNMLSAFINAKISHD